MDKKNLYKITIYNEDRTSILIVAQNKLDAVYKYSDWVKNNYSEGFIDENQDFEVDFIDYVYVYSNILYVNIQKTS